jgi:DNA-binding XRE family transcriptional regulator
MVNGRKIRDFRERERLSTTELGQKVGASQTMIVHIETGIKQPSIALLQRIATFFRCKVDDLLQDKAI